ncbi:hypothetical protein QFW77_17225 [Luteimonas sp. RD2P54]|uniref:Sugar transporter n=1 Tax=Luteimonas endophytica TaxID=3042023 RepID=A0ABT6JD01_9GAMM|nr:hypothetical protein [Luteimonas endophytica]MDH5824715.1 hypothetical protein [Luteimonas endophytica]
MDTTKPPATLWMVAAAALVWNLIGVAMFFLQTNLGPEGIAALPPEQQQVYAAMPAWLDIPYGIAVFGGVLGSIALLLRRRWAVAMFAVSLLAVLVQMAGVYALTPAWEVSGAAGLPMALLVLALAGFLLWYARRAAARGWLR